MKIMIFVPLVGLLLGLGASFDSTVDDPVAAAIAHPDRLSSDHLRDAERKPARVLDFFDIKRGMRVVDLMAGDGYYTEILSRAVGNEGTVYCQNTAIPLDRYADKPLSARLKQDRLPNVVRLDEEFSKSSLPKGLDAAILVRFYHDFGWQKVDRFAFNKLVFDRLKPGGVFGIVDHNAKAGAGIDAGMRLHRIEADFLRREVEAAGFVLEAESFVLADVDDALDWSIFDPKHAGRDTTSRFVHLYRKPFDKNDVIK